jgi:hypothetical protein
MNLGKIPTTKFLLNLLVQDFKAFINSKILFLIQKDLSLNSAQSAQQPASPHGLLAHLAFFFLIPHRNSTSKQAAAGRPHSTRWPHPATSAEEKKSSCHPSFISPLNGAPSTLQSFGNWSLQDG